MPSQRWAVARRIVCLVLGGPWHHVRPDTTYLAWIQTTRLLWFVAVNDKGVPCAGFRQCGSSRGVTDLNPEAQAWDVPGGELQNENPTSWGRSQWIYDVYFSGLPTIHSAWKDEDGKWYSALSTDGCNSTTRHGRSAVAWTCGPLVL